MLSSVPLPGRPLVVTADPDLLDDLLRLAATAGVELDVVADPGAARGAWERASVVVVGADAGPGCVRARLPRRSGVTLVGDDLDDAGVWELAVRVGAEHVVFLPDAEPWLTEVLADAVEGVADEAVLLAVVGGRGGAGATTLACALAVTAARRSRSVLLVDGDPLGGGIDLALGGEDDRGLRWPDLGATRGRVPAAALTAALPVMAGLSVLSWDRGECTDLAPEALQAVLAAGRRGCDLVVVDLPRWLDAGSRSVLVQASTALLVVPAEVRAAAAASRVAAGLALHCRDVRVVVRGPAPTGLAADAVSRALGLPLAGDLRAEPHLDEALERGEPPAGRGRGPLAALCGVLLDDLLPADRMAA